MDYRNLTDDELRRLIKVRPYDTEPLVAEVMRRFYEPKAQVEEALEALDEFASVIEDHNPEIDDELSSTELLRRVQYIESLLA